MIRGRSAGRARVLPHVAAVLVAALVFALVYPPFGVGSLAFLALAPVTLVFLDPALPCSLLRAASAGLAFGLLAAMAIVGPWMTTASIDYFDRSTAWSLGFTLFVNATNVALFYAPTFAVLRLFATATPLLRVVGAASVWIAFELLRANVLLGNAWALLGQGVGDIPLMREAAAFGGVWTLGWAAATAGAALGVALQPGLARRDVARCAVLGASAPILLALLGFAARGGDANPTSLEALRVAVVQAEIPSRDVWDPARRLDHWNTYVAMTSKLEPGGVDLVVWPESAVPFLLDADVSSRRKLAGLAGTLGAAILLGAPRSESTSDGEAVLHNSVYFFPADGSEPLFYDKRRLLPFVETMPAVLAGLPLSTRYEAGKAAASFEVRGWRIAPLLCFEAVYPDYAREAVRGGADLLVNLSNDAWFARGAGPEQHFAMSVLRAVELRRPMVRAANGGISGAVGPDMAELGPLLRREKGLRVYEIDPPAAVTTVTAACGDAVGWAAVVVSALALLLSRRRAHAT